MKTHSKKTRERAARILAMVLEGKRTIAIGRELQISGARVRKIAADFNIEIPCSQTMRLAFHTKRRRGETIIEVARRVGVSPSTIIDRIVGTVVDDGPDFAIRRLGKLAQPRRDVGRV